MAFHETRLPEDIERGATGGPMFKTTIIQLDSGYEQRNIDWAQTRGEWDIGYGLMSLRDQGLNTYLHKVRDFFYARRGRAYGFRFKDWADFEIGDVDDPETLSQPIGVGDGTESDFQVFKRYTSGGENFDRIIKKLVSGSLTVLSDGVIVSSDDYTVNLNTGLITFDSPPSNGAIISVACEFDVPVRFDTDKLNLNVEMYNAGQIGSIPIVEIRV